MGIALSARILLGPGGGGAPPAPPRVGVAALGACIGVALPGRRGRPPRDRIESPRFPGTSHGTHLLPLDGGSCSPSWGCKRSASGQARAPAPHDAPAHSFWTATR